MLAKLFERRSASIAEVLGMRRAATSSSGPISEQQSLTHSAVWACVWLISDLISTLPLKVFRDADGRTVEIPTPSLFASPSIEVSQLDWVSQHVTSLLLRGNAYGVVTARDRLGWPTAIENVNADAVRVTRSKDGQLVYRIGRSTLDQSEVLHIIGRPWAGLPVGLSVIDFAARNIKLGLEVEKFGADFFGAGAHPTGVLTTPRDVTAEAAAAAKDRFKAAVGARDVVVLGQDLKFSQMQINPDDSQFLETLGANAATVARWFGVPPELVSASVSGQSVTYANLNDRMRSLLIFALNPWVERMQRAYTQLLPRPQYVKFSTGGLLRADIETRYRTYAQGLSSGFLTVDEVRGWEELPPLKEEK